MAPAARRRKTRLILVLILVLLLVSVGLPVLAGLVTTYAIVYPPCSNKGQTPTDYGYNWEDVTLAARAGGQFRAYFIPGTNGATIIIPPPFASGRGSRLFVADLLVRHGYAAITFESRRCAGMGPLSLGYKEMDEVADVLNYLRGRGDIDMTRIGIVGFSSAGATSVMSAAQMPELRAVVAEGGYGDFAEGSVGIGDSSGTFLLDIYRWSIGASYHLFTGVDIDRLSPLDVVSQISPRPLLLIYGSRETTLEGARQQQAAAGPNAQLWIVEGARHGNYLAVAPEEYEAQLIRFFDNALSGPQE